MRQEEIQNRKKINCSIKIFDSHIILVFTKMSPQIARSELEKIPIQ